MTRSPLLILSRFTKLRCILEIEYDTDTEVLLCQDVCVACPIGFYLDKDSKLSSGFVGIASCVACPDQSSTMSAGSRCGLSLCSRSDLSMLSISIWAHNPSLYQ